MITDYPHTEPKFIFTIETPFSPTPLPVVVERVLGDGAWVSGRGFFSAQSPYPYAVRDYEINGTGTREILRIESAAPLANWEDFRRQFYSYVVGEPVHWSVGENWFTGHVTRVSPKQLTVEEDGVRSLPKPYPNAPLLQRLTPRTGSARIHKLTLRRDGRWYNVGHLGHRSSIQRGSVFGVNRLFSQPEY